MNNKIHECTQMTMHTSSTGKTWGHIELEHLAKPGSVTVYLNDCFITPESFDIYGQPIIATEMALYFNWKYQESTRNNHDNPSKEVPATVYYEPQEFYVPKSDFDSVLGIRRSLDNLKDFTEMLDNRKRYLKINHKKGTPLSEYINNEQFLGEYVIWKRFILDKFANIFRIEADINMPFIPDVCELEFFDFRMNGISYPYGTAHIPKAGSFCPICGREFSTYDLQTRLITTINEKHCHGNCKEDYYNQQEKAWSIFVS